MSQKLLSFFIATLFFSLNVSAQSNLASQETYFYKLSKALQGHAPTYEQRQDFEKAKANGTADQYLQKSIQDFMSQRTFSLLLKDKVYELMRIKSPSGTEQNVGAYDNLVASVIENNLSWDQLLLAKEYSEVQSHFSPSFYDAALGNQNNDPLDQLEAFTSDVQTRQVKFQPDDQRVAGILTTDLFFSRYANTALNKNRRRSAAVFRTFLCDNMVPAVPVHDQTGEDIDYATIFPGQAPQHKGVTEADLKQAMTGNIHGQLADCRACHYKLDPMGQTFGFSAAGLAPEASPGALRFRGADNRNVDIPLRGLGDLAQKITEQPEYASCQVQHFWNWFIGKDIALGSEKKTQLIAKFNEVGRRTKDFVTYLVTLPEFRQKPQILNENQILAQRASAILKNCTSCHNSQPNGADEVTGVDLAAFPYSEKPNDFATTYTVGLMRSVLDTAGNGKNRSMPPKESQWKLSEDEYATLKKWLDIGAPDFQGKLQVPPEAHQ